MSNLQSNVVETVIPVQFILSFVTMYLFTSIWQIMIIHY